MRAGALVVFAACGAAAPAPRAQPMRHCPLHGYQILLSSETIGPPTPADDAITIAWRDYHLAVADAAHDRPREAARRFLDCASRFLGARPDDAELDVTTYDAHVCYDDAIYAFADAGALATDGKIALDAAAARDPRAADFIRAELASNADRDCR